MSNGSPSIAAAETSPQSRFQTFRALSNPTFRRLWLAGWVWYVNRMMEMAVLSWLVLELTDSPSQVALVGVFRMAPMFLLGLIAGSVSDRFPRKYVMISTQVVNLGVTAGMLAVLVFGQVEPWHAFLATFLTGCAWAVDFSARRAYFAEIFNGDALTNAISLDVVALTGSSIIGPLFAGTIIELIDFSGSYALMLFLFIAAGGVLFTIPKTRSLGPSQTSVLRHMAESVTTLVRNRALLAALTITVSLNFFGFPFLTMVPVIGRDVLGANAFLYGVLAAAAGVGSLAGAILIASRQIRNHGQIYSLGRGVHAGDSRSLLILGMVPRVSRPADHRRNRHGRIRHDAAHNRHAGRQAGNERPRDGSCGVGDRRKPAGNVDRRLARGTVEPSNGPRRPNRHRLHSCHAA